MRIAATQALTLQTRVPSESSQSEIESEIRIHILFTVIENDC